MIYTITRLCPIVRWYLNEEEDRFFKRERYEHDCVGYFNYFSDAIEFVESDAGRELVECLYDYLVIESCLEGIQRYSPSDYNQWWYKYNDVSKKWEYVEETPKQFYGTVGFAM